MDKEDRREFAKVPMRFAEITFAVMMATPATLLILKQEISIAKFLVSAGVGTILILLLLLVAYKILKR